MEPNYANDEVAIQVALLKQRLQAEIDSSIAVQVQLEKVYREKVALEKEIESLRAKATDDD